MWPLKRTYRRTLIALQRDLGQNPWDGPAIVDHQPWSFESVWPCQLGIAWANGGWSWRIGIKTPSWDLPKVIVPTAWDNSWINWSQLRVRNCSWRATKVCFSVHVCYLQPFNGHRPNSGRNAMVLATASNTERFLYWICVLVMISLSLQKCVKNRPGIRHVGGCPHTSRNCLNIDGFEDFLLGIHLFNAHRWSMGRRPRTWIPNQKILSIQTFGAMAGGSAGTPAVIMIIFFLRWLYSSVVSHPAP